MCNFEELLHTDTKTVKQIHRCAYAHTHTHPHTHSHTCECIIGLLLCWGRKWDTVEQWHTTVYRSIHKQHVHNVFMRCHCRQHEKKSYSDVCPPKSDTDAANSFGVVTQASGQGDETLPWPNERVLLPGLNKPPPHLPIGVLKRFWVERDRSSYRASRSDSPVINSSA